MTIAHNEYGTVYLKGPWSPSNKDWHAGYLRNHTESGIWVFNNNFNQDGATFYPATNIQRIRIGH